MPITYQQALEKIYELDKFGSRLGLSRIRAILKELGTPQKNYKCVLVAGSNGKGSTVEMIGSILQENGAKVGTYFSPQIEKFPERARVNGECASKREIVDAYQKVSRACEKVAPDATFFEVVTAMALVIFRKRKVKFAVLEAGLGGRLDAVNAVQPEISVITSISLEHTSVLGKTIAKIAREKCGIARGNRPLVCGLVAKEAAHEIGKVCHRLGAIPVFIGKEVSVTDLREDGGRYSFHSRFHGKAYSVSLAAGGEFQVSNACAALAACSLLSASRGAIEEGLAKAAPKFRFWKISSSPLVIADCAHNPEAACALANEVAKISVQGKRVLLFSAMKDKEYAKNLLMLAPEFESLVITEVALERGASLKALASAARRVGGAIRIKSAKRALSLAKKRAGRQGLVVIAGSIYLLAELFGKDEKVCGQAFSALESKFQYNKIRIAQ